MAQLRDIIPKFSPRTVPRNYNVGAESSIQFMQVTEYVISYSNRLISIGVIRKQEDRVKNTPIVMQFGHWKREDGKNLHVGCVLAVRGYSSIVNSSFSTNQQSSQSISENDIIVDDFLNPTALAYEWKVIEKPEITETLGSIISFNAEYQKTGNFLYSGKVVDKVYKMEFNVPDDLWPSYVKLGPNKGSAVILHWAKIVGEYVVYNCQNDLNLILPQYAKPLFNANKIWAKPEYWLTWVDCHYTSD